MRLATRTVAFILLAALGCGRSAPSAKVEIAPLTTERPDSPERLAELHRGAEVLIKGKQFESAEQYLSEAFAMALRMAPGDSIATADVFNNYAVLETARYQFKEADGYLAKAEDMYRRFFKGEDHPLIANVLNNRAFLARTVKDAAKAEQFEREAKEMDSRLKAKKK